MLFEKIMFEDLKIPQDLLPEDGRFGSGPTKVPVNFLEKLLADYNYLATKE